MNRLKRVVVLREDFNSKSINNLSAKFPNVFFVKDIDREFEDLLLNAGMNPVENQSLFLLDDFSFVMEEFNKELDFKEVFEDIKTLL